MSLNSTQLFIEQLLTGFLTLIALSLFFASIYDLDLDSISTISKYEGVVLLLIVSCSYPLGIFSDNIADGLLKKWARRIKKNVQNNGNELKTSVNDEISVGEILRVSDSDWLSLYFTYSRKRIRVSRSAAFSILLLTPGLVTFEIANNGIADSWKFAVGVLVVGIALFAVALWNWHNLTTDFYKKSKRTWEKMEAEN